MNYSTLFKTIQGYLENDFPSFTGADSSGSGTATLTAKQQIDTFIKQAEQRIYNSVQFPQFRKNQTGSMTTNNKYLATPSDFLAVYELAVTNPTTSEYEYLLNKDVSYIRAAYPNPATTGIPKYYALFDENTLVLGPTPAANYTVELHYFYYPESITAAASGQTWLGDNFDSTLLYGSLVEGYTFMKGEADVIAAYAKRYEEAMILAKRLGDGMERRDAYRSGQVRMSVN
jgi:hypothetical protein